MKRITKYFILLLISGLGFQMSVCAQSLRVEEVLLEGVKKNDKDYLLRFISSVSGELLDSDLLGEDIQQLRRRTGVAHAEVLIDTLDGERVNLRFQIREQRTLLPQLGLGGIKGNFWWLVGLQEHNLFGREQALLFNYLQNDGRPNFKIFFQNSRIKASPWGLALDINHSASIEPLYFTEAIVDFRYSNTGTGFSVIRNLGFNQQISVGANLFQETYEKNNPADIGTTEGPDFLKQNKLLGRVSFSNNRLQYENFYRRGMEWNVLMQSVANFNDNSWFLSLGFEGKKYWRPFTNSNIAVRLTAAIATNRPSPFAPFVLDSRVNIRGVGNRVDRGTAQFVINTEWRQTLFHSESWAGQVIAFSDSGTWRNPGGKFSDLFDTENFQHFVGGGVRLINKKIFKSTLRLDYGFDLWNNSARGIVFGIGQYF